MSDAEASASGLSSRFCDHVLRSGVVSDGDTLVVATSGGRDSLVLLHLLRFTEGLPALSLVAAHLDHAMRPESAADASWVRGLCAAWDVRVRMTRADPAPSTEAEARRLRYAFLRAVASEDAARAVVTAHHADDQAETVLFRAVRGTGVAGLQGIRARRSGGVWRPLLPFARRELSAYAAEVGLRWRDDPTNEPGTSGPAPARSVIRGRVLPELEARVAPGAGRALVALARRAAENESAWRSLLPGLLDTVDLRTDANGLSLDRDALAGLHPGVCARILRELFRRMGTPVGEAGTRALVEFTRSGSSGAAVPVAGTLELRRELHRLVLSTVRVATVDEPLAILRPDEGQGDVRVGGLRYAVSWGPQPASSRWRETFDVAALRFPLEVRGWAPGDRVHMEYGTKKLKKLLLETRVPSADRHRLPVLVDSEAAVLWVPGVVRSGDAAGDGAAASFYIGIGDAQTA
ncbi:MAG: tRNA lysidine(34) synthetase TilS [Gemmatimonadetes bacterium]|nr:tRNA lysidine(34) synthetase TilS [Gemmatimonadota bacterium]